MTSKYYLFELYMCLLNAFYYFCSRLHIKQIKYGNDHV